MEDLCGSLWEKTTAGTGDLGDVVGHGRSGSANRYSPRVVHRTSDEADDPFGDRFSSLLIPFSSDLAGDNSLIGPSETMAEIDGEIFSRLHPNSSFASASAPSIFVSDVMGSSLVDHGGLQISSLSPGSPDWKRKSHTRRVVCVPALEAGSGKPGGDVIPPDLWAWRKYGQKPIKGSPYPRGYYRCSSSKQCSARKQVEKSRSDPTMLVITYTSEHNHPWPTQKMSTVVSSRSTLPRSDLSVSCQRRGKG
ncbi:uncharacterized protein LOC144707698 isoform X3 [Wolffia australiana]